jgi:hypothetical protein
LAHHCEAGVLVPTRALQAKEDTVKVIRASVGLAAAALLVAALTQGGTAQAQIYPTPQGNCVITPSVANPDLDTTVTLTVNVSDLAGNPVPNVSGEAFIVSQPGTDASIAPATFVTDGAGNAVLTLATGTTAGTVQAAVVIDDEDLEAECAIELTMAEDAAPAEPAPAAPGPPPTGAGGITGGASSSAPWALAGALAVLGSMLVFRRLAVRS